ncbi:hypothetical protein E2C01_094934 [Portunus trituberculatus]|uniref:Uncharacterized protein n=1 Tax=Portunus trituberculatus TaxID=210409 RepID=A0A5B7JY77_PORTR|nr:hypothetical protein [Portunus trituberculatus]
MTRSSAAVDNTASMQGNDFSVASGERRRVRGQQQGKRESPRWGEYVDHVRQAWRGAGQGSRGNLKQ